MQEPASIPPSARHPLYQSTASVLAFRGTDAAVKIDLPAEDSPVFEAVQYGEWDRFGLPPPDKSETATITATAPAER